MCPATLWPETTALVLLGRQFGPRESLIEVGLSFVPFALVWLGLVVDEAVGLLMQLLHMSV